MVPLCSLGGRLSLVVLRYPVQVILWPSVVQTFSCWWRKVVGWEFPDPGALVQGIRREILDPTVCNAMTGSGLWKYPSGTWGRLCVSPPVSLLFFCCSDGQGSSYVWDILGVRAFRLAFCCWLAGFFRCWGLGRLITHLAPGAHAEGGGPGTSGLFSFCTDFP